jgi:hypothetical protein
MWKKQRLQTLWISKYQLVCYPQEVQVHQSYPLLPYIKNRASRTGFWKTQDVDSYRKKIVIHRNCADLLLRLISYSEINEQPGEFLGQAVKPLHPDKSVLHRRPKKRKVQTSSNRFAMKNAGLTVKNDQFGDN